MFTSSFSVSEQEHRQWKPYKHGRAIGFAEHYVCHAVQRSASTRPGIYRAGPPNSGERATQRSSKIMLRSS
jgi:hypothetical protein